MRASWVLVGLGLALGTIAGGAAALDGYVTVDAEEGPATVEPGGAPGTWQLTVTYNSAAPLTEDVQVELEPEGASAWITAHVEPSTITFSPEDTDPGAPRYTYAESALLAAGAHRYAPAYYTERITVTPVADGGNVEDPDENPTMVVLTPDYLPGLEAEPTATILDLQAGEDGHARAQLDSTANGDSHVTLGDVEAPEGCEVDPIREEMFVPLAGADEAVLHVDCPADADGGTLTVTFDQAYAPDPSVATTTANATWDLHVDGAGAQAQAGLAPTSSTTNGVGLATVLGLGALVTAAIAHRRRG